MDIFWNVVGTVLVGIGLLVLAVIWPPILVVYLIFGGLMLMAREV